MKKLFATLLLSFSFCACERKEPQKASVEESKKMDSTVNVEAPRQDFPSFVAWSKVTSGMTEQQVIEILGQPKSGSPWSDYKGLPGVENAQYHWSYGSLYPESASHPFRSDFDVVFSKGLVVRQDSPFGGATIIPSGIPTAPRLFIPEDDTTFNHFPRIIDLRWWSSSGTMPITYDVSIEVKYPSGEWGIESGLQKRADSLHASMGFPGANEGRWRVRGRNQEGVGEWSEYRTFKFTR